MDRKFQEKPIGIFDSGVGGLTVVKQAMNLLPYESIVYFGDTARVPYGTKSKDTIIRFAAEDADFLMKHNVKAIVVACNTASSNSLDYLQFHYKVPVIGVIEPGARGACSKTRNNKIGVIGTSATIESNEYERRIKACCPEAEILSKSCPLFVPFAEEGWTEKKATKLVASEYLKEMIEFGIDTLVLGCTHYPILKNVIQSVIGDAVFLIDSAYYTALELKTLLRKKGLLTKSRTVEEPKFFLSDKPRNFSQVAERFLGKKIKKVTVVNL